MQAHARNLEDEKTKYRRAFMKALESLVGDRQPPTQYSEEREAMKDLAYESAHQASPFIGDCVIEFRQQGPCGPGRTPEARIGKAMLSALGNPIKSLMCPKKDTPTVSKSSNDRAPIATEAKRAGLTGTYQVMADISDLIPPDHIVALLTGLTLDGVQSARKYAKDDSYEFEQVSWPGGGRRKAWEVTGRPPEPEPELPPVPLTPEKRMENDITELKKLVAALIRDANRVRDTNQQGNLL